MTIVGARFGNLVVLSAFRPVGSRYSRVVIRCDCGVEKETCERSVRRGRTQSCGCLQTRKATKHALSHKPDYRRWQAMMQRCYSRSADSYRHYGGRGIKVCSEWHDVGAFIDWAEANGSRPGMQIDRIDVSGDYEPGNCRFVTAEGNARNRTSNHVICFAGDRLTVVEASERYGIPYDVLTQRLGRLKWPVEKALTTAVRPCAKSKARKAA